MIVIVVIITFFGVMVVDGCPVAPFINESCCEVKGNEFKFSTSLKSHVYKIGNFCRDCELVAEGYCDAVTRMAA